MCVAKHTLINPWNGSIVCGHQVKEVFTPKAIAGTGYLVVGDLISD